MKCALSTLCVMMLGLLACRSSTEPASEVNNYPLSAGYVWNYTGQYATFNFRPLRQGATFRDTVIQWPAKAEIVGRAVLRDSIDTWKFRSTTALSHTAFDEQYYLLNGDTLYQYAYRSGNLGFPKGFSPIRFVYQGRAFESLDEMFDVLTNGFPFNYGEPRADSIVYELTPPRVLIFPVRDGLQWSYRPKGTPGGRIDKKVVGVEQIPLPAIIYSTHKIQWLWDLNQDDIWDTTLVGFDYINAKGIIKRTFIFKDVEATSEQNPDEVIGLFDVKFEYLLKSHNIK